MHRTKSQLKHNIRSVIIYQPRRGRGTDVLEILWIIHYSSWENGNDTDLLKNLNKEINVSIF